ncbi:MAG: phosphatidylglycerol lysyltransferase domain-containing protein [Bacillota bacterium]
MYTFRDVQFADLAKINSLLAHKTLTSTWHSATTIFGWLSVFNTKICVLEDAVMLQLTVEGKVRTFSPLAKEASRVAEIVTDFDRNFDINWDWIPTWQVPIYEELGYTLTEHRKRAEYLYSSKSLRTLSGKKLHSKRNFINGFHYKYEFRPYTDCDFNGVMALFEAWYNEAITRVGANVQFITEDYKREREVVCFVLENSKLCNILADVLVIDNRIVGFVAGELMANGVGAIYFEKADTAYKGAYPMIDNLFCKSHFEEVELVNRQEDLDIVGLRKSKMSYCPVGFAELYTAERR